MENIDQMLLNGIHALDQRIIRVETRLNELEKFLKKHDLQNQEYDKRNFIEIEKVKDILQSNLAFLRDQVQSLNNIFVESVYEIRRMKQLRQAFYENHLALESIVKDLDYRHKTLLKSWRWRLGNRTIQVIDKIRGRRGIKLAVDVIGEDLIQMQTLLSKSIDTIARWNIPVRIVGQSSTEDTKTCLSSNVYKLNTQQRVAFYTALVGDYDTLPKQEFVPINADFILFTDNDIVSDLWKVRPLPYYDNDPVRIARYIKTHPHELLNQYYLSVWMDANIIMIGDFNIYINKLNDHNIWLGWRHSKRSDIFEEVEACISLNKDHKEVLRNQATEYKEKGFNELWLYETSVIARVHNDPLCIEINSDWWNEIKKHSKRDQIALPYVLWNHGYKAPYFRDDFINIGEDDIFKYHSKHKKNINSILSSDYTIPCERRRYYDYLYSANKRKINFIVCVHNALDDVRKCLESLILTRCCNDQIVIIDDGSEKKTELFLAEFSEQHTNVKLLRNNESFGFTKAANQGIKYNDADYYCLINSDTIVPKRFRDKMVTIGESNPYLGVFGPMSNAAGWQTIPQIFDNEYKFKINSLPKGHSCDSMDNLCNSVGYTNYLQVPFVNGFCYIIKKNVIEKIGYLDENSFPNGYGVEDDYSLRTNEAGFHCGICTMTYVWHSKSKSYGSTNRKNLSRQGKIVLQGKYGTTRIKNEVKTIRLHPGLKRFRAKVKSILDANYQEQQVSIIGRKARIGVIIDGNPKEPPDYTYYRTLAWLQALTNKYEYRIYGAKDLEELSIFYPDKLIIHGSPGSIEEVQNLLQWCAIYKIPVQYEVDDRFCDVPRSPKMTNEEIDRLDSTIQKIAFASQNIIVSSEKIKESFSKLNPKVYVLKNHLSKNYWKSLRSGRLRRKTVEEEIRIAYFWTESDNNENIPFINVFSRIKNEFSNVRMIMVGNNKLNQRNILFDIIKSPQGNITYPSYINWLENILDSIHIGIVPMSIRKIKNYGNDMNFLENSATGILGIYSDIETFREVKDLKLGIISRNTETEWFKSIRNAIVGYNVMQSMCNEAFEYLKRYRVIENNVELYDRILEMKN